jgi:hypothetical protein
MADPLIEAADRLAKHTREFADKRRGIIDMTKSAGDMTDAEIEQIGRANAIREKRGLPPIVGVSKLK